MSDDVKNIFVSHVHEDDVTLQKLKDLLRQSDYNVRDSSIHSSKPNDAVNADYIKSQILAPRIRWASTLVVLVSPKTCTSKWCDWEIEYAMEQGKRIVGVWEPGSQACDLPTGLEAYADAMVGWQADRVMDAITGKINNWYNPDGQEHPLRSISRYNC
jgi:hypothetical protein